MTKTCISIYNEFSNIGPTRRTWLWRLKVKVEHGDRITEYNYQSAMNLVTRYVGTNRKK